MKNINKKIIKKMKKKITNNRNKKGMKKKEMKKLQILINFLFINKHKFIKINKYFEVKSTISSLMKNLVEYKLVVEDEKISFQETIQKQNEEISLLQNSITKIRKKMMK